jgi:hypothetical protein
MLRNKITIEELEARLVCFFDTKKRLVYFKTGGWGWCDKGDEEDPEIIKDCVLFNTAWEAILDATEPYYEEND